MNSVAVVGACLWRVSTAKWEALDDNGHAPEGVSAVELIGGTHVRVHYGFTADKVVTFTVTPDEQFAAAGVRCGASVGLCYADIYFYMGTSQTPVNPGLLSRSGANVWIDGRFRVRS